MSKAEWLIMRDRLNKYLEESGCDERSAAKLIEWINEIKPRTKVVNLNEYRERRSVY